MAVDDRTLHLELPKPVAANLLEDDVVRLREFADDVDLALWNRPTATVVTGWINSAVAGLATSAALSTGLAGKVSTTRTVSAGTGLIGGGPLSGDISLALSSAVITSLGKADAAAPASRTIFTAAGLNGGGNLTANRTISPVWASQAEAEESTSELVILNPLRGQQLVSARRPWADQSTAENGSSSNSVMSPLRTAQQVAVKPPGIPVRSKSADYTLANTDTGYTISASAGNITVPSTLAAGTTVCIWNDNASTSRSIIQGSGLTMYSATTAATGNRTLGPRGFCTVTIVAAGVAVITGARLT